MKRVAFIRYEQHGNPAFMLPNRLTWCLTWRTVLFTFIRESSKQNPRIIQ